MEDIEAIIIQTITDSWSSSETILGEPDFDSMIESLWEALLDFIMFF